MIYLQYCLGNPNLERAFRHHIKHQADQSDAVRQLETEECISGEDALEKVAENVRSAISKQKEKLMKEKEAKSCEIDRQAMKNTLQQRIQESEEIGKLCLTMSKIKIIRNLEQSG